MPKIGQKISPWKAHEGKWINCQRCALKDVRRNVCIARGSIPCDILFIGEAPGPSENLIGKPFIGPAGKLLDRIIEMAIDGFLLCPLCKAPQFETPSGLACKNGHGGIEGSKPTVAFSNLIGCIPLEDDNEGKSNKLTEPPSYAVKACHPRLIELVRLCKPRLIVHVGREAATGSGFSHNHVGAEDWLGENEILEIQDIDHPAYMLRLNHSMKDLAAQRATARIMEGIRNIGNRYEGSDFISRIVEDLNSTEIPDDDVPF